MADDKKVVLYRMVLPDHTCPYGIRAKELLEGAAVDFEDRILSSRADVEAFKQEHEVATTPLVFVDDEPIGGSEELEEYLAGEAAD